MSRGLEGGVGTATEHDAGDASGHRPPRDRRVSGEQAECGAIVRQHVGGILMDAALLSRMKDLLEEKRAEAESLQASATPRPMSAVPSSEGPYRATPTSSSSCPSTSATTAIRWR